MTGGWTSTPSRVVGHQILTGKQPFEGSSHSILYKHVFEPPPRIFDTRPDAPGRSLRRPGSCALERAGQRFHRHGGIRCSGERRAHRSTNRRDCLRRHHQADRPQRSWPHVRSRVIAQRGVMAAGLCARAGRCGLGRVASVPGVAATAGACSRYPPAVIRRAPPLRVAQPPAIQPSRDVVSDTTRSSRANRPNPAKKEYALLTVTSEPWGTLFVGNKEIGPTPIADYPLPVGTHRSDRTGGLPHPDRNHRGDAAPIRSGGGMFWNPHPQKMGKQRKCWTCSEILIESATVACDLPGRLAPRQASLSIFPSPPA